MIPDSCEQFDSEGCVTSIWHNQTQMTGIWSFDIFQNANASFGTLFYFMGTGEAFLNAHFHPANGYVIHVWGNGNIDLDYVANGYYQNSSGQFSALEKPTGWCHIQVTRNQTGYMEVKLNATKIIGVTHNAINGSEKINIQVPDNPVSKVKFDNISYEPLSPMNVDNNSNSSNISTTNETSNPNSTDVYTYSILICLVVYSIYVRKGKR